MKHHTTKPLFISLDIEDAKEESVLVFLSEDEPRLK
jgi:hypothetical protein